jgi:hypothetical protein
MDNSFFILSKQQIEISRFHICTWDIENEKSFVEIGIEFNFPDNASMVDFRFLAPFVKKEDKIRCLLDRLKLRENSKFIFNDVIKNSSPINEDDIHGTVLDFKSREKLAILPLTDNISVEKNGLISFKLRKPQIENATNFYVRFLIHTTAKTLSTEKKGITQTTFIHDIKLNENRNLPNNVATLMDEFILCTVKNCFCFHVIPNSFNIAFVDQNKLKNVRILEVSAFKKYLPDELKTMKKDKYMIVFNKETAAKSYSFFTIFTKEIIGTKQILLAIGANILCSFLFIRFPEYSVWILLFGIILLLIILFSPYSFVKRLFRK